MDKEDFEIAFAKAFNEGQIKGYEEGVDAMIQMLQNFKKTFNDLKEARRVK
jgi:flagellar biosynthesis/type III secretory pathway protein FliH